MAYRGKPGHYRGAAYASGIRHGRSARNAFATGRNPKHAAVRATSGILEIMNDTELEGVFAHELGHVKNYDIRVSMIAMALAVVVSFIADAMLHLTFFRDRDEDNSSPLFIVFAIVGALLAPLVRTLIQLAISRRREYLADATGALATRYPEGSCALEKIAAYGSDLKKQRANTATAHLFFANPLKGGAFMNLFSTTRQSKSASGACVKWVLTPKIYVSMATKKPHTPRKNLRKIRLINRSQESIGLSPIRLTSHFHALDGNRQILPAK